MATKVVIFNDFYKAYYSRRKKKGLPYKRAIPATAYKLIRMIFSILSNKTFFGCKGKLKIVDPSLHMEYPSMAIKH